MVNRLVERDYEDREFTPADFGSTWPQIVKMIGPRVDHPEFRASTYVRVPDEAIAKRIADAAGVRSGLFSVDLVELAVPIADAAGVKVEHADVPAYASAGLETNYGAALFAIPDIGRTSPAVHTKWGYDVVLFTADVPAVHPSADAYTAELVAEARKAYFKPW